MVDYAQKLTGQLDNLQPVNQTDKDNVKDLINLISNEADFGSANSQAEITQVLSQKQKDMSDHYQATEDIKQTNLESERTDRFEKLAEQVDKLQNQIINQPNLTPEQQEQYINQLYTSLFNANDDLQQAPSFKDMDDIENTMNKVAQDVIKDAKLTNDNQQPTPTPTPVPTDDNNDSSQPTNPKPTASEVSQEVGQAVKQAQETINQNTTLTPQQKQSYLNALTNLQTDSNSQLNQPGFDPSTFNMLNLNQNVQAILTSSMILFRVNQQAKITKHLIINQLTLIQQLILKMRVIILLQIMEMVALLKMQAQLELIQAMATVTIQQQQLRQVALKDKSNQLTQAKRKTAMVTEILAV